MVLLPLKAICTQSGYAFALVSFQPPPLPQLTPARSPLLIDDAGKAGLIVLEAVATPPLLASATLTEPTAFTTCDSGVLADAALAPVSYTHLRAHETPEQLVCRLLLQKKKLS